MLTSKQKELLVFISQRLGQDGVPPSFDEMRDALALKSKSGIHRLITGLEERGFIRRLPHRARALEIIKLPENLGQEKENFLKKMEDYFVKCACSILKKNMDLEEMVLSNVIIEFRYQRQKVR